MAITKPWNGQTTAEKPSRNNQLASGTPKTFLNEHVINTPFLGGLSSKTKNPHRVVRDRGRIRSLIRCGSVVGIDSPHPGLLAGIGLVLSQGAVTTHGFGVAIDEHVVVEVRTMQGLVAMTLVIVVMLRR